MERVYSYTDENGKRYAVPKSETQEFFKHVPRAQLAGDYRDTKGNAYAVPGNDDEMGDFVARVPDAKSSYRYRSKAGKDYVVPYDEMGDFLKTFRSDDAFMDDRDEIEKRVEELASPKQSVAWAAAKGAAVGAGLGLKDAGRGISRAFTDQIPGLIYKPLAVMMGKDATKVGRWLSDVARDIDDRAEARKWDDPEIEGWASIGPGAFESVAANVVPAIATHGMSAYAMPALYGLSRAFDVHEAAMESGHTPEQAITLAAGAGAIEGGMEYVSMLWGGGKQAKEIGKALGGRQLARNARQVLRALVGEVLSEAGTEGIQEGVGNQYDQLAAGDDIDYRQSAVAAGMGAGTGAMAAIIQGGPLAAAKIDAARNPEQRASYTAGTSPQELAAWTLKNPDMALALAGKESPSRKDFEAAGLPRVPAAERSRIAADLKELITAETEQKTKSKGVKAGTEVAPDVMPGPSLITDDGKVFAPGETVPKGNYTINGQQVMLEADTPAADLMARMKQPPPAELAAQTAEEGEARNEPAPPAAAAVPKAGTDAAVPKAGTHAEAAPEAAAVPAAKKKALVPPKRGKSPDKRGRTLRHFTTPERAERLRTDGVFSFDNAPIHGTGSLDDGPKTGRFAGRRIYLSLDDEGWGATAEFTPSGDARPLDMQNPGPDMDAVERGEAESFYDYARQQWMLRSGRRDRKQLEGVDVQIDDAARVLVIESPERLAIASEKYGALLDNDAAWDRLARDYDVVEIRNTQKHAGASKFFRAAMYDQAVVLNAAVAHVAGKQAPPAAPAEAAAAGMNADQPTESLADAILADPAKADLSQASDDEIDSAIAEIQERARELDDDDPELDNISAAVDALDEEYSRRQEAVKPPASPAKAPVAESVTETPPPAPKVTAPAVKAADFASMSDDDFDKMADQAAEEIKARKEKAAPPAAAPKIGRKNVKKAAPPAPAPEGDIKIVEPRTGRTEIIKVTPPKIGGKENPGGKRVPRAIIESAAKHGVQGIESAAQGLYELFGANKRLGMGLTFDENTYAKAKPHFQDAIKRFSEAGAEVIEVFKWALNEFGEEIMPYLKRFKNELAEGKGKGESSPPAAKHPQAVLSEDLEQAIRTGQKLTWQELFEHADKAYQGTRAEGKYQSTDAYEALEVAVNHIAGSSVNVDFDTAIKGVGMLEGILDLIPTQTNRSGEKDLMQQFSTPPHYAYAANWVAGVKPGDIMLEPSGGTGSLASHAKKSGARVIANELSPRRAELLKQFADKVTTEDAEQLSNLLDEKPTVVVMNPPFSQAGDRMKGKKMPMTGANHIEQALALLQPGGRLVAIVGRGMEFGKPTFTAWWSKIGKQHRIRANVGVSGDVYAKYGTRFGTQLVVIDKVVPDDSKPVVGVAETIPELLQLLAEVRDDRPASQTTSNEQTGDRGTQDAGGGDQRPGVPANPPPEVGDRTGDAGRPGEGRPGDDVEPSPDTRRPAGGKTGGISSRRGSRSRSGKRPGRRAGRADGDAASSDDGDGRGLSSGQNVLTVEKSERAANDEGEGSFETYSSAVTVKGAQPHPAPLVESAAMASVAAPHPQYSPHIPSSIIESGALSSVQLEPIIMGGAIHQQTVQLSQAERSEYQTLYPDRAAPSVKRRGFFVGDGTGVGKGREAAGFILDNWNQGRRKAIWVSEKQKLFDDAIRDWTALGGSKNDVFSLNKVKSGAGIAAANGIVFATYDTLGTSATGRKDANKLTRVEQLAEWFGADYDGVIVFDESHGMGNAVARRGARGATKPASKALMGVELQRRLPNARVVYMSATGATEVSNLSYADRLGLWGEGTPFTDRNSFINQIAAGGIAAMELVARDMKALGVYLSRTLSFKGVGYKRLTHALSSDQREIYNTLTVAWQSVLQNINAALELTAGFTDHSGNIRIDRSQRAAALSAFWGTHQRFFNQILTSMQMPSVIASIKADVDAGNACVVQIVNTLEAATERALSSLESEEDLESLDITPRDQLIRLIEGSFPVVQMEQYIDANGNELVRPVIDSQGNQVMNREAVAMRDALIDRLASIAVPESPIDQLINHFGHKAVAEITGRGRRVIVNEKGEREIQSRSISSRKADIADFMDDKKQILIFSDAGGTGASYHADKTAKNQRPRKHYVLQAGWRADKAIQGLGRSHRSNQAHLPEFVLVETDLPGHKRFISTIARRLEQLGALSRGQRDTGGGGLFTEADNLESSHAYDALQKLVRDIVGGDAEINVVEFEKQTGLSLRTAQGAPTGNPLEVRQFLNRLLSMDIDMQNKVFSAYAGQLVREVEIARATGTLDIGMEEVKAVKIEKVNEVVVSTDPRTGAETKHVELAVYNKSEKVPWLRAIHNAHEFVKNKRSGEVYVLKHGGSRTDPNSGQIVDYWERWSPSGKTLIPRSEAAMRYDGISEAEAKTTWDDRLAKLPDLHKQSMHMITGVLLPVWNRLSGRPQIKRAVTQSGERILGRVIPNGDLARTLDALGVTREVKTPPAKEALPSLLNGDEMKLVNGWIIRAVNVSGDQRIEVAGIDTPSGFDQIRGMGGFTERHGYRNRAYLPTGDAFADAYDRLVASHPVENIVNRGSGDDTQGFAANRGTYAVTPEQDAEYLAAVERGDMETVRRLLNEAIKATGVPILDDSASEAYSVRRSEPPAKTVKAFKLFATKPSRPGELFPLFVGSNEAVPQGVWLDAIAGKAAPASKTGKAKVKSKLGPLAFRPGWHAGDLPLATHIGVKNSDGEVYARRDNEVWAEVEMAADVDYQPQANATKTKDLDRMPENGLYRFKTNPNMTGQWIISGSMKVSRVLSQQEVDGILSEKNLPIMPWENGPLDLGRLGLTAEQAVNHLKLAEVTRGPDGKPIPLSQRFDVDSDNILHAVSRPGAGEAARPGRNIGARRQDGGAVAAQPTQPTRIIDTIRKLWPGLSVRARATWTQKKAPGWYSKALGEMRLANAGDIIVAVHELGHHFDRELGGWSGKTGLASHIPSELIALGRDLYGSTVPKGGYRAEGFAEFIGQYLTGGDIQGKAPNLYHWFTTEYLPGRPKEAAKLRQLEDVIAQFQIQTPEQAVKALMSPRREDWSGQRIAATLAGIEAQTVDAFMPLLRGMMEAGANVNDVGTGKDQIRAKDHPYMLAICFARTAGGRALHALLENTTDLYGKANGESLKAIMAPAVDAGKVDELIQYWIAKRVVTRYHDHGLVSGLARDDAQAIIDKYASPEFDRIVEGATDWAHRELHLLVEAGAMTPAQFNEIVDMNPIYAPMMRQFLASEKRDGGKNKGLGKGVFRVRGGQQPIVDPLTALAQQSEKLHQIAMQHAVMRSLVQFYDSHRGKVASMGKFMSEVPAPREAVTFTLEKMKKTIGRKAVELGADPDAVALAMMDTWDEMTTIYRPRKDYRGGNNIIGIEIDGKRRFFEIQPDLFPILEGVTQSKFLGDGKIASVFRRATSLQRLGATGLNPAFGLIRNPLRDTGTAAVTADYHFHIPLLSTLSGMVMDIANSDYAKMYHGSGLDIAGRVGQDLRSARKAGRRVTAKNKVQSIARAGFIDGLVELLGHSEIGPRLMEYRGAFKHAKKMGWDDHDALVLAGCASKDVTVNFSRAGTEVRKANEVIMFANAGVQSLDKIGRSLGLRQALPWAKIKNAEGTVGGEVRARLKVAGRTTARALAFVTAAALANYLRNRDKDWWKKLPAFEKWNYLHVGNLNNDGPGFRIPLPFDIGAIFGALPVALLEERRTPGAFKEALEIAFENSMPIDIGLTEDDFRHKVAAVVRNFSLFTGAGDILINEDWKHSAIIPRYLEGLDPDLQYTHDTTTIGKIIGKQLGVAPVQVDHILNVYSGQLYKRAHNAVQTSIGNGDIDLSDKSSIPVIGTLFLRPNTSRAVEDFYERLDELERRKKSDRADDADLNELKAMKKVSGKLTGLWRARREALSAGGVTGRRAANEVVADVQALIEQHNERWAD